jgi:hypothetical protein
MEKNGADPKSSVVRTLQIIVLALAAGVLSFALVAFFLTGGGLKPWNANAWLSLLMAVISLTMIPARLFVPALIVQAGRRSIASGAGEPVTRRSGVPSLPDTEEGKLLSVYLTQTIFGSAILEGAAFLNLVAFLQEGQLYSLILGLLLLAGLLAGVPTLHSLESWLERQLRRMQESRDLGA